MNRRRLRAPDAEQPAAIHARSASGRSALCSPRSGRVKQNVLPWPWPSDSAHMRPPCAATMPLLKYRPSPAPVTFRADSARYPRRNSCASSVPSRPIPSSRTRTVAPRSSAATDTVTVEPSSEYFRALDRRFTSTCRMRRSSHSPTTLWSAKTSRWWRAVERMPSDTSRARAPRSVSRGEMERRPASREETSKSVVRSSESWSTCSTINAASASRALRSPSPPDSRRRRSSALPLITVIGVFMSCQAMVKMSSRSRSRSRCPVMSRNTMTPPCRAPFGERSTDAPRLRTRSWPVRSSISTWAALLLEGLAEDEARTVQAEKLSGRPVQSHDGAACVDDEEGVVHAREDGLQLQGVSLVLHGHLLRHAQALDGDTRLRGDGAEAEDIRIFVGFGSIALRGEHTEHPLAG